jgi:carbon monoxide dehydrogenase subunit G
MPRPREKTSHFLVPGQAWLWLPRLRLSFSAAGFYNSCLGNFCWHQVRTFQVANPTTEFGGQERFAAAPETLYTLLTDLDAMASTIPDLVSSEKVDPRTLKCVVRPGFSFLRGTMKLTIALDQCQQPESAAMRVAAQGIGVSMNVSAELKISAEGTGSRLNWTAKIDERKGLIAAVSPGLIQAAADQVIRHAWSQVRRQLGE